MIVFPEQGTQRLTAFIVPYLHVRVPYCRGLFILKWLWVFSQLTVNYRCHILVRETLSGLRSLKLFFCRICEVFCFFFLPASASDGIIFYCLEVFCLFVIACSSSSTSERTHFWNHCFLTLGYRRHSRWDKWSEARELPQVYVVVSVIWFWFSADCVAYISPKYYSVLQQPQDLKRISALSGFECSSLEVIVSPVVVWGLTRLCGRVLSWMLVDAPDVWRLKNLLSYLSSLSKAVSWHMTKMEWSRLAYWI